MQKLKALEVLAGVSSSDTKSSTSSTNLHAISGEVGSVSEHGKALIRVDGLVFSEENEQFIEVDTLGGLEPGDIATIILTGEDGKAKTPLAVGSVGSIDRITVRISAIEADYVKADFLEANYATIDNLDAGIARIDDLEANTADIDAIRANSAKVSQLTAEELTAATGYIGSLISDNIIAADLAAASAYIDTLTTNNVTASDLVADTGKIHTLTANQLAASVAYIDNLISNNLSAATLVADVAKVHNLTAEALVAATAYIASLGAAEISVQDLQAVNAYVETLLSDSVTASSLVADIGKIHSLTANELAAATAYIASLTANSIAASDIIADHAVIDDLDTNYAHITDGVIDNATISYADVDNLDVNYAEINMANVNNAWITNGTVKDGAISNAMIANLSASKLTAGIIDGSTINVTNLNADNITAGTINGQRIGTGSLSLDKLSEDVYTESEVDDLIDDLNDRIDGAIETFTGTVIPTLNNYPASSWNTNTLKDQHVGDVYYVVDSTSQQNGYCYRFSKTISGGTTTYAWQLIKDSDVTAALSRLQTAEGKIGAIETFDTTVSSFMTDTDSELSSVKSRATSLETRMTDAEGDIVTKVDTTTFNTLSQTVDGHTSSITSISNTLTTKADGSTVSSLTTRVNTTETDISSINTTLGSLQTTVASKADGSTVETISSNLNSVTDTVNGHTQTISSIQSTQTTMQGTLDKTLVESTQLWFSKANTTAPAKPTSAVTSTATTGNAWTTAVPAYNSSYPNYYYCYQWKYSDGTYGWSAVTRDIAMGESQATARTADSKIDNLQVGGRNLLRNTANPSTTDYVVGRSTYLGDGVFRLTPTSSTSWLKWRVNYLDYAEYANNTYTFSLEARLADVESTFTTKSLILYIMVNSASRIDSGISSDRDRYKGLAITESLTTTWAKYYVTVDVPNGFTNGTTSALVAGSQLTAEAYVPKECVPIEVRRFKLEIGNKATDWTSAPEDVDADIATAQATADKNVKESIQLWYTKANTTAPSKPSSAVTSTATTGNTWTTVVPTYNSSYPHYYYCYQYKLADGTYSWSDVVYDRATTENQSNSRSAVSGVETLTTKTNNISDTVDGHTQTLTSINQTTTTIQQNATKSVTQLWYTKANTTAPSAPTSQVTSTSTNGNAWRVVVPAYNASYPNYFYCYQYEYLNGTFGWSSVTRDIGMGEVQSTSRTASSDLATYITTNDQAIQSLQNQVDGQIEAWYKTVDPTTSNEPASEWTTDALKARHEGDLYYNVNNGHSWRWLNTSGTYSWQQIPDSDAAAALAAAQNAQSTANTKRRIFTTTPTVPYDIGDLWVTGSIVKYATVAKTSTGSYAASDWSQTATDDTAANAAQSTANKNVKETIQLWFSKANTTTPSKPTSAVTSTSTSGNAWRVVVPTYNASYPYYYYCYQYKLADGTYTWSDVVYDRATTEAQSVARTTSSTVTELQQDYAEFKQTTNEFVSTVGTTYVTKGSPDNYTSRMSAAETSIQQNSNNILLRATKAEVKQYGSGTGNPVTASDAIEAPLRSLTGDGWAEQDSTSGKNLFPIYESATTYGNVFTRNSDGSVHATGTHNNADYNSDYRISVNISAGTYTLSGCPTGGSNTSYCITAKVSDGQNSSYYYDTGNGKTFIVPEGSTIISLYITIHRSITTAVDLTFYPQLELGSTATEYEPYTGGAPSPSPDYPQEIRVAKGRNLLDASEESTTIGHVYNSSGEYANNSNWCVLYAECKAGRTYTVSGLSSASNMAIVQVPQKGANGTVLATRNASASYTVTPSISGYIGVSCVKSDLGTSDVAAAQLELGSTPSPYVPYGHVGLEVQGKNLLTGFQSRTNNGITFTVNSDGSITANGTATADATCFTSDFVLTAGVYTISFDKSIVWTLANAYLYSWTASAILARINSSSLPPTFTITEDNTCYLSIRVLNGQTISNLTFYPQLELGSTATDYEPYHHSTTPIPLPSTGYAASLSDDTADELNLDSAGHVQWVQRVGERTLPTSVSSIGTTPYPYNSFAQPDMVNSGTTMMVDFISTHAPAGIGSDDTGGVYSYNGKIFLRYPSSVVDATTASQILSLGITVLYPLATPVTHDLGYINMPTLSEGCHVSIPELDELGVTWYCAGSEALAGAEISTIGRLSSAEASIQINADGIESKVSKDGVISSINQSPESVTINANRVNIEGAAIFSSGRLSTTSLNNAYDAKGAAATAKSDAISSANSTTDTKLQSYSTTTQMNTAIGNAVDGIQVGGRNLFSWRSMLENEYELPAYQNKGSFGQFGGSLLFDPSKTVGQKYTISFDCKSPNGDTEIQVYNRNGNPRYFYFASILVGTAGTDWKRFSFTITNAECPSTGYSENDTWWRRLEIYAPYKMGVLVRKIKVEVGTRATDWTPAPEDVVTEEQYIYISKASGTSSVAANTTWVTATSDSQNTWTTKRPTYNSSYPVLFVAKQKKSATGTVTCTTPLKDDTTTVIDGGHITTGTIDASRATITNINASNITSGTLSADRIDASTIHISYSNVDNTPTIPTKVSELTNDSSYATTTQLNTEANQRKATYATSSTDAGTAAKVAACTNFALYTGATVTVAFSKANTATTPTLNVNSTGAKTIKGYSGAALTAAEYSWVAGSTITFTYDGTYWRMQDGGALQAKADAANSATAAAEVMGGFTILWNYAGFTGPNTGEAYICAFDPATGSKSDADGWVKFNSTRRTITKGMVNPDNKLPYNIPIYIVTRLASSTATTGTNYLVWYSSGWKWSYTNLASDATIGNFTWTDDTDIILGKFVEPSSEGAFTDCEIFNPPLTAKHVTTDTVTARSANALATTANNTANAAAPKTDAVSEEQLIYISKASGTASVSANTTWVTTTSDSQNTWTTKRPTYNSSYPVLFIAKQRKTVSGTVTCTTPLKDDTTTVIDGGHITTGTIDASVATITNINASNISSGTLSADRIGAGSLAVGKLASSVQTDIANGAAAKTDVDNLNIGGRNLFRNTSSFTSSNFALTRATVPETGLLKLTPTTSYALAKLKVTYLDYSDYHDGTFTISCEAKNSGETETYTAAGTLLLCLLHNAASRIDDAPSSSYDKYTALVPTTITNDWVKYSCTFTLPDDETEGTDTALVAGSMLTAIIREAAKCQPIYIRNIKLERGNRATDWSPAPEDFKGSATFRGTCNTAEGTADKTVACAGFASSDLVAGTSVVVYMVAANTSAGALTLNVNSTGAKAIHTSAGAATSATNQLLWGSTITVTFTYDGTYWRLSNNPGTGYATCTTAEGTAAKVASNQNRTLVYKGATVSVTMSNSNTSSSATLNYGGLGAKNIYYGTSTTVPTKANGFAWPAGATVIFTFDGAYWRTGNQTFIDGGNILTGTISADRIGANSLSIGKLSTEAQDEILNSNIELGGRNLLLGTRDFSGVVAKSATIETSKYIDCYIAIYDKTSTSEYVDMVRYSISTCTANTQYTLSFWAKASAAISVNSFFYRISTDHPNPIASGYNSSGNTTVAGDGSIVTNLTTGWQRYWITWTTASSVHYVVNITPIRIPTQTTAKVYLAGVKLEKGNKASEWSPAPEDPENQISYYNRYCRVGNSSNTETQYWRKFASLTTTSTSEDYVILLDVESTGNFGDPNKHGRLRAHLRTNSPVSFHNGQIEWVYRGSGINPFDFVFAYKSTSGTNVQVELWCKCSDHWTGYLFKQVTEGTRLRVATDTTKIWTLHNDWSANGAASITSGFTQLTSYDQGTAFVTRIDDNGITVHPSSTTNNRAAINANGMQIYQNGTEVASYGSTTRVGAASSFNTYIDSTGVHLRKAATDIANFKASTSGTEVTSSIDLGASGVGISMWVDTSATNDKVLFLKAHDTAEVHVGKYDSSDGTLVGSPNSLFDIRTTGVTFCNPYKADTILQLGAPKILTASATVTLSNDARATVCSLAVTPGSWLLIGHLNFATGNNGRRSGTLGTSSTATDGIWWNAVQSHPTEEDIIMQVAITANTTYYLRGYQNNGGNLSVTGSIKAIQLH